MFPIGVSERLLFETRLHAGGDHTAPKLPRSSGLPGCKSVTAAAGAGEPRRDMRFQPRLLPRSADLLMITGPVHGLAKQSRVVTQTHQYPPLSDTSI